MLKAWIVKRIENTLVQPWLFSPYQSSRLTLRTIYRSDADSDVLADYVIALLKHDGDGASVRKLCEEEIPDFLTEGESARRSTFPNHMYLLEDCILM